MDMRDVNTLGGKHMDMFMDKRAQKLTAQEIIHANTAADVEELNKLKNQIAEYNECLTKLQKLIDDGFLKLSNVRAEDEKASRLIEESTNEIKSMQEKVETFNQSLGQFQEQLVGVDKSVASQLEFMSKTMGEKIDQLCGQLEAQASGRMSDRLDIIEENVHKECVKVYRNVQAVMVEENSKQNETLDEAKAGVAAVKTKLGAVMGISVAAMLLSLISVLVQILGGLNILPF